MQDWLETCFIVRKPGSALAQLTQQLSDEWTDEHDRLILKLLGSSEVGLGPLWTKDNRPVRKVNGAPHTDRICKCAHPRPIHLRNSHTSLPCITLLQESRLVRLQRRQVSRFPSSLRHIEDRT